MRLLYVIEHVTGTGGLQRILIDKLNYLAELTAHEIVLMTVWHTNEEPRFPISPAVRRVNLNVPPTLLMLPMAAWRFRREVRKLHPDVTIHFRAVGAFLILTSGWTGPTIMEMHSARQAMNHRWLYPLIERRIDAIVCLTKGDAANYPNARHVEVIPNFSSLTIPSSLNPQPSQGRGRLARDKQCSTSPNSQFSILNSQFGNTPKHVVWVGRDCPEKNLPRLRRIWAEVEKTHPDWQLDIHHNTSDIIGAYTAGSIFVLTSNTEGMPMSLLEAQQCGLPIVAFDCPYGPADIILPGTGYLIPLTINGSERQADEAFIEKLTTLMDDAALRRQMGQEALTAARRYNKQQIMSQWLKLFVEINKS